MIKEITQEQQEIFNKMIVEYGNIQTTPEAQDNSIRAVLDYLEFDDNRIHFDTKTLKIHFCKSPVDCDKRYEEALRGSSSRQDEISTRAKLTHMLGRGYYGVSTAWYASQAMFIRFGHDVLGFEFDMDKYHIFCDFAEAIPYIIVDTELGVFTCPHPKKWWKWVGEEGHKDSSRVIHREDGPAMEWEDSDGEYRLNGVTVPKYLVETPARELDLDFFLKEKNADVKSEFIKKYGIENMIELGKVVDSYTSHKDSNNYAMYKKSEYKLVDMSTLFEGMEYAPYLAMRNLTTGAYHLEGVDPECKTIEDALSMRMGFDVRDYQIAEIH